MIRSIFHKNVLKNYLTAQRVFCTQIGNLTEQPQKIYKPMKRLEAKYKNQAPKMFEFAQRIIAQQTTLLELIGTDEFKNTQELICKTTRHSNTNILNLIKSVLVMGMPPDSDLVQFLEGQLLDKLKQFNIPLLIEAYNLYEPATVSPLREEIKKQILLKISDNLEGHEVSLNDLILLIKNSKNFHPSLLIQLDQQITRYLDYNDNISLNHLCYLIVLLSRFGRRNKPLIRTVVSKLLKIRTEGLYSMPPHLINVLSALSRLNFYEVNLIEKAVDILIDFDFLMKNSPGSIRDFIVTISQFNFYNQRLFDYYIKTLIENPKSFDKQDLITFCITLAKLNCQQEDLIESVRQHIVPELIPSMFDRCLPWFNYVYSLKFLNIDTPEHLRSILSIDSYKNLENEIIGKSVQISDEDSLKVDVKDLYHVMSFRRKYLQFVGLSKTNPESYEKLFDSVEERQTFDEFIQNLEYEPMKRAKTYHRFLFGVKHLIEAIAPKPEQFAFRKQLPHGVVIDIEMLFDPNGEPHVLTETDPSLQKIAIMCVSFTDTLLDRPSTVIGGKEVEFRILRSLGYTVVPVHQNILQYGTSMGQVKFLKKLIQSHLEDPMFKN